MILDGHRVTVHAPGMITAMSTPTSRLSVAPGPNGPRGPAGPANLSIGATTPTPPSGESVLWIDTTGGDITLNLVTGD